MMKKRFVIVTSILIVLAFLAMIFVPLAIDALGASTIDQKKSQLTDKDIFMSEELRKYLEALTSSMGNDAGETVQ